MSNKEKVRKLAAPAGNIVSVVCLITLIVRTMVHWADTGSVTGLQLALAAGATVLLIGGAWAATHPVTPQSED